MNHGRTAAWRHDHPAVPHAPGEHTHAMLNEARRLPKADALPRSGRFIGPVTGLATLPAHPAKADRQPSNARASRHNRATTSPAGSARASAAPCPAQACI